MGVVVGSSMLLLSSLLPMECASSSAIRGGARLSLSWEISLILMQFPYHQQCLSCWALMIPPPHDFHILSSVSSHLASFRWAHLSPQVVIWGEFLFQEIQGWERLQAACGTRQAHCPTKLLKCNCFSNSLNYSSVCH